MLKYKRGLLFLLLFLGATIQYSFSQIFSEGIPIFNPIADTVFVPEYFIRNGDPLQEKKDRNNFLKDNQFAHPVEVSISPGQFGVWLEYPELNLKVWLLRIKAENTSSLNLILNPFNLKEGVKLFFYDKSQSHILGAITHKNNKRTGVLPLTTVVGNEIYCELQLPLYQDDYGELNISKIGLGFPLQNATLKSPQDRWYGTSKPCHINANCYSSKPLNKQKRAVCRIIYQGSRRCTGTLINNLKNDETPYILTAGHCFNIDEIASEAVFDFNFESPGCESKKIEPSTVSGATVVAAGFHTPNILDTLDFVLLKLTEKPPFDYNVYYSGWDATQDNVDSTYIIHHPNGDIKKISMDRDAPQMGDFGGQVDSYTHWLVSTYEVGSSEVGSSGSGLMNQDHRLIGTLTSGDAACSDTINDLYQKFLHSFNDYEDPRYQLKHWLDPKDSGKLVSDGFDPALTYRETAGEIVNFSDGSIPTIVKQNNGYGYLAGHNYQQNCSFAERYKINGSKYLVGAKLYFANIATTQPGQYVEFVIWNGGETPGNVLFSKKILISDLEATYNKYPDTMQFVDFDTTVLVNYDFYFGFRIAYTGESFALKTILASKATNSAFTYLDGGWKPLQLDGSETYCHLASAVFAFDFKTHLSVPPDTSIWSNVRIYPNPVRDQVQIYFKKEIFGKVTCRVYNITGVQVLEEIFVDPAANMPLHLNLKSGLYILRITNENELIAKTKLVVF